MFLKFEECRCHFQPYSCLSSTCRRHFGIVLSFSGECFWGFQSFLLFHPIHEIFLVKQWPTPCDNLLSLQPPVLFFTYGNVFFVFFKQPVLSPNCLFTAYCSLKEWQIWVYKRSCQAGIPLSLLSLFHLPTFFTVDRFAEL